MSVEAYSGNAAFGVYFQRQSVFTRNAQTRAGCGGKWGHGKRLSVEIAAAFQRMRGEVVEPDRACMIAEQGDYGHGFQRFGREKRHLPALPVVRAGPKRGELPPQRRTVHVFGVNIKRVIRRARALRLIRLAPARNDNGNRARLLQFDTGLRAALPVCVEAVAADALIAAMMRLPIHIVALPEPLPFGNAAAPAVTPPTALERAVAQQFARRLLGKGPNRAGQAGKAKAQTCKQENLCHALIIVG